MTAPLPNDSGEPVECLPAWVIGLVFAESFTNGLIGFLISVLYISFALYPFRHRARLRPRHPFVGPKKKSRIRRGDRSQIGRSIFGWSRCHDIPHSQSDSSRFMD